MRAGARIVRTAETTLRQRSVIGAAYKNNFSRANAALYWHDPGTARTCDLGTDRKSANWLRLLALDKTEQKSRPHNRAFPRQEVAQISVLDGMYTQKPEDVSFGFMPKVRLRTCRRTRSNASKVTRAVEETSIPIKGLREANSREARVVGCLLGD